MTDPSGPSPERSKPGSGAPPWLPPGWTPAPPSLTRPPEPRATLPSPYWSQRPSALPPAQVGWVHAPPTLSQPRQGNASRVLALTLALVVVFVVGFAAGGSSGVPAVPGASPGTSGSVEPGASVPADVPSDFGVFWEALKIVRDNFVDPSKTTDENVTWGAIRGMLEALGDTGHSVFLTPDQVTAEANSLNGRVSGIGVVVDSRSVPPEIVSVIAGSPAAAAGLRPGDVILAVDGAGTETLAPDQIVQRIRGEAGTTVVVTVRHPGETQPVDVSIVRADVVVPASSWAMVPGTKIADIHVHQFSSGAGDTARQQIQAALDAGADKIVLDLRGNPGGYVSDAIELASQFLPEGSTVYQEKDRSGTVKSIPAEPGGIALNVPMVVLIDQGSASAAEIVSGAIKGNDRGTLVGETTFGTGTVLNTFTLSDGSAIRLGVLEWLTPTGETIFGTGITPDIVVALPTDGTLLEPEELKPMTPDQFKAAKDTQLQKAVELLAAQASDRLLGA